MQPIERMTPSGLIRQALWIASISCVMLAGPTRADPPDAPQYTELVSEVNDSVVNISTQGRKDGARLSQRMEERLPEFFERYFKRRQRHGREQKRTLGSGFIISSDGYVLTNNHVVKNAREIYVRLRDRRELQAEVVGRDPGSDLALLKVNAEDLPALELNTGAAPQVGERVLAIGSPFGFDYSVTAGIISAKQRSLPNNTYVPFLQTDAAVNPGNSGGPLLNMEGEVIGVNSQIVSRSGGYMGLSFAVPAKVVADVVAQLKENGEVSRGWLGVLIQDVTQDLADSFGLQRPHGALVAEVKAGGPAEEAGLRSGDVIVSASGTAIERASALPYQIGMEKPDTEISLEVVRGGERRKLEVTLGETPDDETQRAAAGDGPASQTRLGLAVTKLPPQIKQAWDIQQGIAVKAVAPQGPGAAAGIRQGDVIVRMNNETVTSVEAFRQQASDLPAGQRVPVLIVRKGQPRYLGLRVPSD